MSLYTIRPIAEQELDGYALYIAKNNLNASLRLYEAAEETYQNLAMFVENTFHTILCSQKYNFSR